MGVIKIPDNARKDDLRIIKTERALNNAMFTLLRNRDFGKITVGDICGEAMISRATFYAHFVDKYDLLEYWLLQFIPKDVKKDFPYEQSEEVVNQFIHKNKDIINNLLRNRDNEILEILYRFILSTLRLEIPEHNGKMNPKFVVLSNVFAGGILHYLSWQIDNKFPQEVPPINIYSFGIIEKLRELELD